MRKSMKKTGGVKKYTPDVPVEEEAMQKKRGGAVAKKKDMKVDGKKPPMRADRRARGGGVGSPLSAAAQVTNAKGHKTSASNADANADANAEDD